MEVNRCRGGMGELEGKDHKWARKWRHHSRHNLRHYTVFHGTAGLILDKELLIEDRARAEAVSLALAEKADRQGEAFWH